MARNGFNKRGQRVQASPPKPHPNEIRDPRFIKTLVSTNTTSSEAPLPHLRVPVKNPKVEGPLVARMIQNTPIGDLIDLLASYRDDPLGFVLAMFPWGEPGTPLEKNPEGPDKWQRSQLDRIGRRIREGKGEAIIEEDVASGHGVGKSAEVSWLVLWAISTSADTRGVVTANTDTQLRTKTWAELAKWYDMFLGKSLFRLEATKICIADDVVREKKWRIDAIPWSESNTEGFAGLHNQGGRILVIFDEASAIADKIWEVTSGALSDGNTEIIWCRYGNPTRTSGEFFNKANNPGWRVNPDTFEEIRTNEKRSNTFTQIDSRNVRITNKKRIQEEVEEYGEDSDRVRVRIRGLFPRAGASNFISPQLVFNARRRRLGLHDYQSMPKVMGVDPARFGDDMSVITLRQGLKLHYQVALSGFDGPDLAGRVFELCRKEGNVSCVVYDAIGVGADLDSSLRRIPGLPTLVPITWGVPAKADKEYHNQRAEAWGRMRTWMEHAQITDDEQLDAELTSIDYTYDGQFRIQLESKKDIKKDGRRSPDRADSLALTMLPELIDRKVTLAKVRPQTRRKVVWSR